VIATDKRPVQLGKSAPGMNTVAGHVTKTDAVPVSFVVCASED
jgi:hypothetical protein